MVPNTVGQDAPEGIKARGVIHWVDAVSAVDCAVNIYDRLFNQADPDQGDQHFLEHLNPDSLKVVTGCKAEAILEGLLQVIITSLREKVTLRAILAMQLVLYSTALLA